MLLKRQENEKVIKAIYKSSNILASTYDKETSGLTLIFNKGTQYKYSDVKVSDYTRLELGESQGKVFNTYIKPYSFEKLPDIDGDILSQILNEVEILHTEEQNSIAIAKSKLLINYMQSLITTTGDNILTTKQIEGLQSEITKFLADSTN